MGEVSCVECGIFLDVYGYMYVWYYEYFFVGLFEWEYLYYNKGCFNVGVNEIVLVLYLIYNIV